MLSVVAINFFSWQYKLVNGGLTGYSLFLSYVFNTNTALLLFILNTLNIVASFVWGGQKIGFKAVYGYIFTTTMLLFTQSIFELEQSNLNLWWQNVLATSANAFVASIGVYLCLKNGYSTGSFSTTYLVFKRYFPHISAPLFLTSLDIALAVTSFFILDTNISFLLILNSIVFFCTMKLCEATKLVEYLKLK